MRQFHSVSALTRSRTAEKQNHPTTRVYALGHKSTDRYWTAACSIGLSASGRIMKRSPSVAKCFSRPGRPEGYARHRSIDHRVFRFVKVSTADSYAERACHRRLDRKSV